MTQWPPDPRLVDLWRGGDEAAARQIFDAYANRLVGIARQRIGQRLLSRIDPEDIVQSVFRTFFVRARDGRFSFADQDDLCKLLIGITLRKTLRKIAFHRAAKRDAAKEVEQGESADECLRALATREPTADEAVMFLDQLEHFLNRLSAEEQKILALRMAGLGSSEIAKKIGGSDRTVRRVFERLRVLAKKEGLGPCGENVAAPD